MSTNLQTSLFYCMGVYNVVAGSYSFVCDLGTCAGSTIASAINAIRGSTASAPEEKIPTPSEEPVRARIYSVDNLPPVERFIPEEEESPIFCEKPPIPERRFSISGFPSNPIFQRPRSHSVCSGEDLQAQFDSPKALPTSAEPTKAPNLSWSEKTELFIKEYNNTLTFIGFVGMGLAIFFSSGLALLGAILYLFVVQLLKEQKP